MSNKSILGYETSSVTTSFTLFQLSKNPEIQTRLREEIKEMLLRHDGKITFEGVSNVSEMPYLQQVLNETLRLYSVLPALDRVCINRNGVSLEPISSFRIPCGMPIIIPIFGLGRDEKYFKNPLVYDPDRFSPENIDAIPSCAHIAFGAGPRNCLGERLGLIQTKTAICNILKDFRIETTENSPAKIGMLKNANHIQPDKPLFVNFVKDFLC
jgi:cytochrome P450 family 6